MSEVEIESHNTPPSPGKEIDLKNLLHSLPSLLINESDVGKLGSNEPQEHKLSENELLALIEEANQVCAKTPFSNQNTTRKKSEHFLFQKSSRALLTLLSIFIFFIGAGWVYIKRNLAHEEIRTAQAAADLAMALLNTQSQPLPLALESKEISPALHLDKVLNPTYRKLSPLDEKGHFISDAYTIETIWQDDLSHFIVIAHPKRSLLNFLIAKATLFIDSRLMQIRKLTSSDSSLVPSQTWGVDLLKTQSEVIPLTKLCQGENIGFSIPIKVQEIDPEAVNLIYNAPRYYLFGDAFFYHSLDIDNKTHLLPHSSLNRTITTLPHFVLYTSQEIDSVTNLLEELPKNSSPEFLVGHVQMDKGGKLTEIEIFTSNELSHRARALKTIQQRSIQNLHPLAQTILSSFEQRRLVLQQISTKLVQLLEQNNIQSSTEFSEVFTELTNDYRKANEQQNELVVRFIEDRCYEYMDQSPHQITTLIEVLRKTQAHTLLPTYLLGRIRQKSNVFISTQEEIKNASSPVFTSLAALSKSSDIEEKSPSLKDKTPSHPCPAELAEEAAGKLALQESMAQTNTAAREEKLQVALKHLQPLTEKNPALWEEVLRIRAHLVDAAEGSLRWQTAPQAGLFTSEGANFQVKKQFDLYIHQRMQLGNLKYPKSFRTSFERREKNLNQIIQMTGHLQQRATLLDKTLKEYHARLNNYLQDDEKASKPHGCHTHPNRLHFVQQKLQALARLEPQMTVFIHSVSHGSHEHELLAKQELEDMKGHSYRMTLEALQQKDDQLPLIKTPENSHTELIRTINLPLP